MNRWHLGSVLLIVLSVVVAFGCSGNQPAANANAANGNTGNQAAAANTDSGANGVGPAADNRAYPQEVAEEFVRSCEEAGSKPEFCECVFEKVQQQYTFEEFSVIESKIVAGNPPDDFVEFTGKARAACAK